MSKPTPDISTHAFRDGCIGVGGIFLNLKDRRKNQQAIPTGRYSTNYKAEAQDLKIAAMMLEEQRKAIQNKVVVFSDALSVTQALSNPQNKELNALASAVSEVYTWAREGGNWIKMRGGSLIKKQKPSSVTRRRKYG